MLGELVGGSIDEITTESSFARGDTFCATAV
jgi:hypothetical protein